MLSCPLPAAPAGVSQSSRASPTAEQTRVSSPRVTHRREHSGLRRRAAPCSCSSCRETRWTGCSLFSGEPGTDAGVELQRPGPRSCSVCPPPPDRYAGVSLFGTCGQVQAGYTSGAHPHGYTAGTRPGRVYSRGTHTPSRQQVPRYPAPGPDDGWPPPCPDPTGRLTPLTYRPRVWVIATCSVRGHSVPAGGWDQPQTPSAARNHSNPRCRGNGLGQPAVTAGAAAANRGSVRGRSRPVSSRGRTRAPTTNCPAPVRHLGAGLGAAALLAGRGLRA